MSQSCPNPLYHTWLALWLSEESSRNLTSSRPLFVYKKALRGIALYPHPLRLPEHAQRVSGIGATIAARIKKALEQHILKGGRQEDVWGGKTPGT
jgi:hypothetical protein